MNPFTAINGTVAALNLVPILLKVSKLSKKPDKSAEEEEVLKSFRKAITAAVSVTLLAVVLLGIFSASLILSIPDGDKRYGTVEGDQVSYVQNTMQYVSLRELIITPAEVKDGDKIILWFDSVDETLTKAIPEKNYEEQFNRKGFALLFVAIASIIGLVITSVVIRKTTGRKFYEWYAKNREWGNV